MGYWGHAHGGTWRECQIQLANLVSLKMQTRMTRICFTDCIDGKGTNSSNGDIVGFGVLVSRHRWLSELERSDRVTMDCGERLMCYLNPERTVFDPKMFMGNRYRFYSATRRSFGLHKFG